ncbi:MAG: hypothetical protein ABI396_02340 [Ktedonobacteraceae bacterium]
MSQSTETLLFERTNRFNITMQQFMRGLRKITTLFTPLPLSELLLQLEEASSPASLSRIVNKIQPILWKQSSKEQSLSRKHLVNVLTHHVLQGEDAVLRLEAAGWLRLLVQAGLVAQPEEIFVSLVTTAVRATQNGYNAASTKEQQAYLKMIFQCFWPFRYPYPAFSWQLFPANDVFYPLASLFTEADDERQDTLMSIFAELPSLDDEEIARYLLPVALQWAGDSDAERRRRIPNVLARINSVSSYEALTHLQSDADPIVRKNAKSAAGFVRRA